jgi:hypothetical protein
MTPQQSRAYAAFRVEHDRSLHRLVPVVAETDDWVEAQRLVLASHHGYNARKPDLRIVGTHPSHTWSDGRCAACGGFDNGSYGSQAPCGYDWRGRALVTAVADELAARGRTERWLYPTSAERDASHASCESGAVRDA